MQAKDIKLRSYLQITGAKRAKYGRTFMAREDQLSEEQFEDYLDQLEQQEKEQSHFAVSIELAKYNADRHRFEITLNKVMEDC